MLVKRVAFYLKIRYGCIYQTYDQGMTEGKLLGAASATFPTKSDATTPTCLERFVALILLILACSVVASGFLLVWLLLSPLF
jgi:hypothetical protein